MLFRVWPLGNDGECSYGGTASVNGGRTRWTTTLPTLVMASEPATAITIRISGVLDRQARVITKVMMAAITVIPIGPPRWVKAVATCVFVTVRSPMAAFSTGRSSWDMPSPSSTAS